MQAGADVDASVDDADGLSGVLDAREVGCCGAREDAVHAEDAGCDHEDSCAGDPGTHARAVRCERRDDGDDGDGHGSVGDHDHRAALGAEELVGDPASHEAAGDATDEETEAPVACDVEVLVEADRVGELRVVLEDAVSDDAGAEFDGADDQEDAMLLAGRDGLDHLPKAERSVCDLLVTGLEVLELTRVAWLVAEEDQHGQEPWDREECREEEHPPVLVYAGVCGAEQVVEDGLGDIEVREHHVRLARDCADGVSPVEGEVDAGADHDAEDGTERAAFADVEPGHLGGDDRHGSQALEEHVDCVEHGERMGELDVPALHHDAVDDGSHGEIGCYSPSDADEHAATAAVAIDERTPFTMKPMK